MTNTQQMPDTFREWFEENIGSQIGDWEDPTMMPALFDPDLLVPAYERYSTEAWQAGAPTERAFREVMELVETGAPDDPEWFKHAAMSQLCTNLVWDRVTARPDEFDENGIRQP